MKDIESEYLKKLEDRVDLEYRSRVRRTYERVFAFKEVDRLPSGCYFHPRCRYAKELCKKENPQLKETNPEHQVSCHFAKELSLQGIVA